METAPTLVYQQHQGMWQRDAKPTPWRVPRGAFPPLPPPEQRDDALKSFYFSPKLGPRPRSLSVQRGDIAGVFFSEVHTFKAKSKEYTVLFLLELKTSDAYQGRGVATALCAHAIVVCEHLGVEWLDLVVNKDNENAIFLYKDRWGCTGFGGDDGKLTPAWRRSPRTSICESSQLYLTVRVSALKKRLGELQRERPPVALYMKKSTTCDPERSTDDSKVVEELLKPEHAEDGVRWTDLVPAEDEEQGVSNPLCITAFGLG